MQNTLTIANQIIFSRTPWSVKEFNLFCIFLSFIKKGDSEDTVYKTSIQEIIDLSNKDWNYGDFTLKENKLTITERVMTKIINIVKNQDEYKLIMPFNLIEYRNGNIQYKVTKEAIPIMIELANNFTKVNLDTIIDLGTYPTKILYLAIKSRLLYSNFKISFTINDYKQFINVSPNTEPRRLKKTYIEAPLKEINKSIEIDVDYKLTKKGKTYTHVEFYPRLNAPHAWNKIKQQLKSQLSEKDYQTWINPIILLSLCKNNLTIEVPSKYFADYIEERFISELRDAIQSVISSDATLTYIYPSN